METEIWKPIKGFEDYEISSKGEIRSIDRTILYPGYKKGIKGRIIRQRYDSGKRYKIVCLYRNKKRYTLLVHRLVYESFYGKLNGLEVNHINGIRDDNDITNLEAVTRSQNEKHKYDKLGYHGNCFGKKGRLHNRSKKVLQIDIENDEIIKVYGSIREAERETGVCASCIVLCCKGKQNSAGGYKWEYLIE